MNRWLVMKWIQVKVSKLTPKSRTINCDMKRYCTLIKFAIMFFFSTEVLPHIPNVWCCVDVAMTKHSFGYKPLWSVALEALSVIIGHPLSQGHDLSG